MIGRKEHLKKIIDGTDVQFSESFEVDGKEMFAHACKVDLEGVVSKVRDRCNFSGRGRAPVEGGHPTPLELNIHAKDKHRSGNSTAQCLGLIFGVS